MQILATADELTAALTAARRRGRVGLVPTMGALHGGHRALIERSAAENATSIVSVFVNPLQFGPGEDLDRYPRDLPGDAETANASGASYLFAPTAAEMYPPPVRTTVHIAGLGDVLEGASRPGHFDGVATLLTRLFGLVGPSRAYFGEKDYQQLVVVRTLVRELRLPVSVVACPTVREPDGLALSSRNRRLSAEGRRTATVLARALRAGAAMVERGVADPAAVRAAMDDVLASEPAVRPDYAEVVEPDTLERPAAVRAPVRLLVAAVIDDVRLIDNLAAAPPEC